MANLNDDFNEILDANGSLGPLVDFNLSVGGPPEAGDDDGTDFFEEWNAEISQFGMNPAILLPGASELHSIYDDEVDAPHELDDGSGFISTSMLFPHDSTPPFLPVAPGYQLYDQYNEAFIDQHLLNPNPNLIGGGLVIDPHLENSGSSDYEAFQNLVGTVEAGSFILPSVDGEYGFIGMSPGAQIAPTGRLVPEAHLDPPIPTAGPQRGKLALKAGSVNFGNTPSFEATKSKGKGKGKAPITGGRSEYCSMGRFPLAETSGNSAGSDLDEGIDLENIGGIGRRPLSMPQAFAKSVGFRHETDPDARADGSYFDSDKTIDLEEYAAACGAGAGSAGNCLSRMNSNLKYGKEDNIEAPSGVLSGNTSLLPPSSEDSADGASLALTIPAKRGRGRPIVPGSKRQRRIQAMAQPDYVPPKRGRPRTNENGQRKRVRRAKAQAAPLPAFSPIPAYTPPHGMAQFAPEPSGQEIDDFSFNQIYKPVILNNEIGYTPDQFILDPVQAEKIQQIYSVEIPVGGWAETAERWRLTFNLNRITPTSESLYHELSEMAEITPSATSHDARDKENVEPGGGDATNLETASELATDIQPPMQVPASQKEVATAKDNIFPDRRLQIIAGDGTYHEMTYEQVLEKLLDERDVYFRTIVWELMQKSQRIDSMEFVGFWNRMSGVWEFT
ncbi:hypothetical protein TWF481_011446 [Arthrobotrys musiformis]|uniref:Uncharacterized protein n=1 Tax=Arthrobotrys musiformis TaxID=47236 RepID=A0AAV9VYF7_9PEZI